MQYIKESKTNLQTKSYLLHAKNFMIVNQALTLVNKVLLLSTVITTPAAAFGLMHSNAYKSFIKV